MENIKANTWNFDDGEFGTESKESTPITMLVGAGYSIVDLAATAVVEGYVSDTDEEFDEDAVAAFGISSPEKLSSSFDSKVTLSPDIFCNEDSDCKRCLEVEPLVLDEYQMEVLLETKIKSEPEEIKPDFIDGKENLQDLKVIISCSYIRKEWRFNFWRLENYWFKLKLHLITLHLCFANMQFSSYF